MQPTDPAASRRRRCAALWRLRIRAICAAALLVPCASPATPAPRLPTLSTVRQVRSLSPSEAASGYPVHLARVQVLLCPASGILFVQDRTGGIAIALRGQLAPSLNPGDLIDIDGIAEPGESFPVIRGSAIRLLGHARLPNAPTVSLDRLSGGGYESQWVGVEGIVQSAELVDSKSVKYASDRSLRMKLISGSDELDIIALAPGEKDAAALLDARVRLRGVVRNRWNSRELLLGTELYIPDLSCIQLLEPPPERDPFALPVVPIGAMTTTGLSNPGHRIHLHGVVTSTWGNLYFSLMDSGHGAFVAAANPIYVRVGEVVDAAGFVAVGDYTAYLDGALVRRAGFAPVPPPARVTAAQAFTGLHDAELIELEGELAVEARGDDGVMTMLFSSAGTPFQGVLPAGSGGEGLGALEPGSRIRLRGIAVTHADRDHKPEKLDILLRSPDDIAVLHHPAWWNFRHVVIAAMLLLTIVLVVVGWNAVLRGRVHTQTRRIQAQLEEARFLREQAEAAHLQKSQALDNLLRVQKDLLAAQKKLRYQASHDGLTGLWNRPALLQFLHRELERVRRHGSRLGILLLDLDHFKTVNDTRGHLTGDAVLREIGLRIGRTIRPYDIAGRYGGEEFLILLPECGREETERSAERIRLAIGSTPVLVAEPGVNVTASIGAAVAAEAVQSGTVLLNQADQALYEAKSAGRNRTVVHETGSALRAG